jgi:hypothetical protein
MNLIEIAYKSFTQKTRDNGDKYYTRTDDAPEWVTDMCHHAHDRMLPDDYRYQFIVDALGAMLDHDWDTLDADELDSSEIADLELEPDIYTHDLTDWLHSSLDRVGIVNDVAEEFGGFDSIEAHLSIAQLQEKEEVAYLVKRFLVDKMHESEFDETLDMNFDAVKARIESGYEGI